MSDDVPEKETPIRSFFIGNDKKATLAKPAGYVTITTDGVTQEYDTYQCCHCGTHVIMTPPVNGEKYGICKKCGFARTCTNPHCHKHYNFEQKLDDYEKGILKELK